MNLMLEDKIAVVTGGARGIGEGIATTFARNGAKVAIVDINLENAKSTAKNLCKYGVKCISLELDVQNFDAIQEVIDQITNELGDIDIWVNNAGISNSVPIKDLTESEWDIMLDINLKGVVFCSKAVFLKMQKRNKGKIINIASLAGQRGGHYAGVHYAASKGGVIVATKCFALSGAPYNINVNSIAPGLIETNMSEELGFSDQVDQIPLGRLGTPEDVGKVALFLASDLSDYVTGQLISVNGGMYMP